MDVATEETEAEPREYSIDELAAATRVPSRTIRFYQSKGALQKPEIRGRKAVYTEEHVERLELVGLLQDRGLRIRAIRDLVARIDAGDLVLTEWLGLEANLKAPWGDDEPVLLTDAEIERLLGESGPGRLADLVRHKLVETQGARHLVTSPALVQTVLQLDAAGVDMETAIRAVDLSRKHLGKLAGDLGAHFVTNAGHGFGASESAADISAAFASVRPLGSDMVRIVFAQEMQRVLRELVASGKAARLPAKSKR